MFTKPTFSQDYKIKTLMENQKIYNRFAVFVIEECYPSGGVSDIVESFDNIEDAVNFAESLPFNDCIEILDFDKRQIVWDSRTPSKVNTG